MMVLRTGFTILAVALLCSGYAKAADTVSPSPDCNVVPLDELKKELDAHMIPGKAVTPAKHHKIGIKDLEKTPSHGVVPDEKTAISLGEILLAGMYGQKLVDSMKPLEAKLIDNGTWLVHRKDSSEKCVVLVGDIYVAVQKNDGRVLGFRREK